MWNAANQVAYFSLSHSLFFVSMFQVFVCVRQCELGLGPSCGGFPEHNPTLWWEGPACCYDMVGIWLHGLLEAMWDSEEVINLHIGDGLAEWSEKTSKHNDLQKETRQGGRVLKKIK